MVYFFSIKFSTSVVQQVGGTNQYLFVPMEFIGLTSCQQLYSMLFQCCRSHLVEINSYLKNSWKQSFVTLDLTQVKKPQYALFITMFIKDSWKHLLEIPTINKDTSHGLL
jgi:hypothetical protein